LAFWFEGNPVAIRVTLEGRHGGVFESLAKEGCDKKQPARVFSARAGDGCPELFGFVNL
jgi:hypothetical protein